VTLIGRGFGGLAFIVGIVAMTWACGPRTSPPAVSAPQPESRVPEPPTLPPAADPPQPLPASEARERDSAACALVEGPGDPITTVALGDPVDPANAPHPTNDSERVLFRQLYETPVRVDCNGRVRPGLAASWRLDESSRAWIVTLREDARFSDGMPVTSAEVLAGWRQSGPGVELRPQVSRLVRAVVAIDDRTLAITPRSAPADLPLVLAQADLAIARSVPDSIWPLGTRSVRVAPDPDANGRAGPDVMITLDGNQSSIRFLVAPDRDRRDLLDQAVDLLITRDRSTLDYAATLPQFASVPLAWRRTYVFMSPGRPGTAPALSEEARDALARDAVRGEARGALDPFWWQMVGDCELPSPQRDQVSTATGRIVYEATDPAARDLAERVVGLVNTSAPGAAATADALLPGRPRRTPQRATGLTGEVLALARRRGSDAGYILSLDRRPLDPCRELLGLVESARWLDPGAIVPLVDTRLRAIVRRGRSGLTEDWDGGLLIAGAGGGR
jgi:hypothetical protein